MLPKSDVKADTAIWMGQHITRKGFHLFFQKHRVRWSIRGVVTVSLNEAAHWRETLTKPWRKNGLLFL